MRIKVIASPYITFYGWTQAIQNIVKQFDVLRIDVVPGGALMLRDAGYLRTVDIEFKSKEDELAFVLTHGDTIHYDNHEYEAIFNT